MTVILFPFTLWILQNAWIGASTHTEWPSFKISPKWIPEDHIQVWSSEWANSSKALRNVVKPQGLKKNTKADWTLAVKHEQLVHCKLWSVKRSENTRTDASCTWQVMYTHLHVHICACVYTHESKTAKQESTTAYVKPSLFRVALGLPNYKDFLFWKLSKHLLLDCAAKWIKK